MLEFIAELFAEIFLEGIGEAINSPRVPVWLRLLLTFVVCGALIAVAILAAVAAYSATGIIGTVVCAVIAFGLFALMLFALYKILSASHRNG